MTSLEPSPSALGDLYDRFGALAYRLALSITGDPAVAERVVSEAFAATWREGPAAGTGEEVGAVSSSQFFSSVMRAVRSRAVRHRAPRIDPDFSFVERAQAEGRPGQEAAVTSALDALPEGQRIVLVLAYFGGLGVDAIAAKVHQPISSVKASLQAALQHLRSALTDRGGVTV